MKHELRRFAITMPMSLAARKFEICFTCYAYSERKARAFARKEYGYSVLPRGTKVAETN